MKPIKSIGIALVAVAALGAVACNNESVSAPEFNGTNSSAIENPQQSSSSENVFVPLSSEQVTAFSSSEQSPVSSSSVASLSSSAMETCIFVIGKSCAPCMEGFKCHCNSCEQENEKSVDCTTGEKLICKDGEWNILLELSSSSFAAVSSSSFESIRSSSSATVSSSSTLSPVCRDISGMCPKWKCRGEDCPMSIVACNHCSVEFDEPAKDCETGIVYVCDNNLWRPRLDEKCQDFSGMCPPCSGPHCPVTNVPCNQCDSTIHNAARDCESGEIYVCSHNLWSSLEKKNETCEHISDVKCEVGMVGCGACEAPENKEVFDCNTGRPYVCQQGYWTAIIVDYECGENEYCDRTSARCQTSPAIGTVCDKEGSAAEFDGCVLLCSGGAYLYAPPPM